MKLSLGVAKHTHLNVKPLGGVGGGGVGAGHRRGI